MKQEEEKRGHTNFMMLKYKVNLNRKPHFIIDHLRKQIITSNEYHCALELKGTQMNRKNFTR